MSITISTDTGPVVVGNHGEIQVVPLIGYCRERPGFISRFSTLAEFTLVEDHLDIVARRYSVCGRMYTNDASGQGRMGPPPVAEVAEEYAISTTDPIEILRESLPSTKPSWAATRKGELDALYRALPDEHKEYVKGDKDAAQADPLNGEYSLFPFRTTKHYTGKYDKWWGESCIAKKSLNKLLTKSLARDYEMEGRDIVEALILELVSHDHENGRVLSPPEVEGDVFTIPEILQGKKGRLGTGRALSHGSGTKAAGMYTHIRNAMKMKMHEIPLTMTLDARPETFDRQGYGQADIERTCFRPGREYDCAPLILALQPSIVCVSCSAYGLAFSRSFMHLEQEEDDKIVGLIEFNRYPTECTRSSVADAMFRHMAINHFDLRHIKYRTPSSTLVTNTYEVQRGCGVFINRKVNSASRAFTKALPFVIDNTKWKQES